MSTARSSSAGPGCEQCRQTGYQGRMAIHEICVITERLRKLIVDKAGGNVLKAAAAAGGMKTLRHDGWRRVVEGRTTVEEVLRVTQEDESLTETDEASLPGVETEFVHRLHRFTQIEDRNRNPLPLPFPICVNLCNLWTNSSEF